MYRTLDEVNTTLDTVLLRLTQLDGSGMIDPSESTIAQVRAEIAGLKETVNQAVLCLDTNFNKMQQDLLDMKNLLNQHLGLPTS